MEMEVVRSYLPFIAVMVPLVAVLFIPLAKKYGKINHLSAIACAITFLVVLAMYPEIKAGKVLQRDFATGLISPLSFRADALGFLVGLISVVMWTLASVYGIEYMSHEHALGRYNLFSLLSLGGMLGVVFTGNLFSLYIFFELLTVASYVLVIHEETEESMNAGLIYLYMGIIGGLILLFAIIATYNITGTGDLSRIGLGLQQSRWLPLIFWGYIIGFGVKAGIFPLHIWLPKAYPVAPSQASALLSGVMAKAGAYGIIRTIYGVIGVDLLRGHLATVLGLFILTLITIFFGSARAIRQIELKRMLAYSSISQIGYVIMGVTVLSPLGIIGGVVNIFNHALMKVTLFLCAGAYIHQVGLRQLSDLKGIGKRMPLVTICFTIAACSMIGFPPFNGFVSKWYLALGALEATRMGSYGLMVGVLALGMLLLSSFMNLIYFGPVVYNAWFGSNDEDKHTHNPHSEHKETEPLKREDPNLKMLIPLFLLVFGIIYFGIQPQWPINIIRQISQLYLP